MDHDLFGQMLSDYWNGGRGRDIEEVLEFEDGSIDRGAVRRYFEDGEASPVDYWCITDADVGEVCVDVGVGAGRFAIELKALRPSVKLVGVELSPGAARIAEERGVTTICGDWTDFVPDETVDSIFLLGNNLGLLGYGKQVAERLSRLRSWCKAGSSLYGTSGRPRSLPPAARGRVSPLSPGTFRSRLLYEGAVAPMYEYTFSEPEAFALASAGSSWELRDVRSVGDRWGAKLIAR